jgi:hypothetical protein
VWKARCTEEQVVKILREAGMVIAAIDTHQLDQ